jgi:predicted permease
MDTLWQDARVAARALAKNPGFTVLAVLTLALGIGANATMLSLVSGLLWRGPAVAEPERLAVVFAQSRADGAYTDFAPADYYGDFRGAPGAFEALAGYYPVLVGLTVDGASDRAWGEIVSGNYFDVLGVRAARGRVLTEADDRAGAEGALVISHRLWTRRFGSDPQAVGRSVRVGERAFTVAGVAPEGFDGVYFTGFQPDLWIPAHGLDGVGATRLSERGRGSFRMMGRLRPGATVEQAQAAMAAVAARLEEEHPRTNRGVQAAVFAERDARPEPDSARGSVVVAAVFLAGVALVLLVACANVASLLLARGTARQAELAVRMALGAGRVRLLRQLLTESALLAGAGGALGLLAALWVTQALSAGLRMPTDIPFAFDVRLDRTSVVVSAAACVLAALASGLAPAWSATRGDLARRGGAGTGRATGRSRLRAALVVGQVAVSCLLLVAAGLAFRSLRAVGAVDPGFRTEGGLLLSVSPSLRGYDEREGRAAYARILEQVAAVPGVRASALARFVPMEFASMGGPIFAEGAAHPAGETAGWTVVTPGYFDAMGTPLVAGRGFDARDDAGARPVAIVNETLAARYWPNQSPLGRRLSLDSADAPPVEVVGVVRDGKYRDLAEAPLPYLFRPLAQEYRGEATVVVRTDGDPRALAPSLREAVRAADAGLPVYDVKTLEELVAGRSLLLPRLAAVLAGVFAGAALLLAMVGLYGVVSFTVARRVREIGIRMALGATRARILSMVVRDGARLALAGVALGLLLALGATRVLAGVLYGVQATDGATFAVVPVLLLAAAAVAALLPARRATAVDPTTSLRSE